MSQQTIAINALIGLAAFLGALAPSVANAEDVAGNALVFNGGQWTTVPDSPSLRLSSTATLENVGPALARHKCTPPRKGRRPDR